VDQHEIVEFLGSPRAHGGAAVERVETHASIVFLTGETAYKLKRAVRYDYLDFSTADRRKAMCEAELALNRRTAPSIYDRVVPITQERPGGLAIDGRGTAVDWLIVMRRFDQGQLLDRLADRGALPLEVMSSLACAIARMHGGAEPCRGRGGAASMAWVIEGNAGDFASRAALDSRVAEAVTDGARAALAAHAPLLDARAGRGLVRQCHGDLHLRNIVLLDGVPTPFDAVEFNADISCIDVFYDLAFLVMDLWRRSLDGHANALFNAYVADTGDVEGLAPLPLFLSCRAAVRAKTAATAASLDRDERRRRELEKSANAYLTLALKLLDGRETRLLALGGLSGSGKTSVARRLAPALGAAPGALVIRSDEIRKRQAGVAALTTLPRDAYTEAASEHVYAALADTARRAIATGHSVIADAVFARPADRDAIERAAASARVPFAGVWLDAPPDVCAARVDARRGDASDARAPVVRAQAAADIGPLSWTRVDASGRLDETCIAARAALGLSPHETEETTWPT
jgi:aminoglycoside phosphotransferase family enzyme/predicted kinase